MRRIKILPILSILVQMPKWVVKAVILLVRQNRQPLDGCLFFEFLQGRGGSLGFFSGANWRARPAQDHWLWWGCEIDAGLIPVLGQVFSLRLSIRFHPGDLPLREIEEIRLSLQNP